jgi:small-conductance mechanosensitive channel
MDIINSLLNSENTEFWNLIIQKIWLILVIIIVIVILQVIVSNLLHYIYFAYKTNTKSHSELSEKRILTVTTLFSNIFNVVIYTTSVVFILSLFGIDIVPVFAGAGIIGLIVGFSAQTVLKDFLMGSIILVENHINIGNKVEIDGSIGKVKSLQLRTIIIVDDENNEIIIPNNKVEKVKIYNS